MKVTLDVTKADFLKIVAVLHVKSMKRLVEDKIMTHKVAMLCRTKMGKRLQALIAEQEDAFRKLRNFK